MLNRESFCTCEYGTVAEVHIITKYDNTCPDHGTGTPHARLTYICEKINEYLPGQRYKANPPEQRLFQYVDKLKAFVESVAQDECDYWEDNCPESRINACRSCMARRTLGLIK